MKVPYEESREHRLIVGLGSILLLVNSLTKKSIVDQKSTLGQM